METPMIDPMTNETPSRNQVFSWAVLRERVISALVLVAAFLTIEIIGGILFTAFVLVVALLMHREWDEMTNTWESKWKWAGLVYITIPCVSVIWLRSISTEASPHAGMGILLYMVFVVVATDIGAFFAGKRFGVTKMAPTISPNKTWMGLAGGVIAAGITGFFCAVTFTPYPTSPFSGLIIGMLLAFVAQSGDLFESWIKRKAGVKDSGEIIPGHGGLLDRVDGMMAAAPVFALFLLFSGFAR